MSDTPFFLRRFGIWIAFPFGRAYVVIAFLSWLGLAFWTGLGDE